MGRLCRRTLRIIRDGSRITLPIAVLLMAAAAILVLQVQPKATVSTKLMVAAPRYARDIDASIVSIDAVETARIVYRDLFSTASVRQAAYSADLSPSAYAPGLSNAARALQGGLQATSVTDKDKVSVISFDVRLSDADRAMRVSAGLIAAAKGLDLKMRQSVADDIERQVRDDLARAQLSLAQLGPRELVDLSATVTQSLSAALRDQRDSLIKRLGSMLRNDVGASDLRAEIAAINERIRDVAMVESGAGAISTDLVRARKLVEQWQADETARRAGVAEREQRRDQLEQQINALTAKLSVSISASELERSVISQRVSVMAAPQIKSARLPRPAILAAACAFTIGMITWLGGTLLLESANPRLRGAEDLISKLNIAAFAVIPDFGVTPTKRSRNGPDRSPLSSEPFVFMPRSSA